MKSVQIGAVELCYKTGSIPSITEEYERIPEKEVSEHAKYINNIDYYWKPVNMLRFWKDKKTEKITAAGRKRWKIESEGFNRQKNWQGDITHACSWNQTTMKNHYLMTQIADMVKQLYE